jgi:hypothetical protein
LHKKKRHVVSKIFPQWRHGLLRHGQYYQGKTQIPENPLRLQSC